jgi:hypothetical protein
MLREDQKARPNIYQVLKESCAMQKREVPIHDVCVMDDPLPRFNVLTHHRYTLAQVALTTQSGQSPSLAQPLWWERLSRPRHKKHSRYRTSLPCGEVEYRLLRSPSSRNLTSPALPLVASRAVIPSLHSTPKPCLLALMTSCRLDSRPLTSSHFFTTRGQSSALILRHLLPSKTQT